jgi:translation elongation factor EF-Ts
MAAQNQIEALKQLVAQVSQKLADKSAEHLNNQEKNAVSAYDSQTKRLAALSDAFALAPADVVRLLKEVIMEAEATSTEGLAPALTPNKEITAEDMAGAAQPGAGGPPGAPPGPAGGIPPGAIAPNANGDDMGAGPAAQPGSPGTPAAPTE